MSNTQITIPGNYIIFDTGTPGFSAPPDFLKQLTSNFQIVINSNLSIPVDLNTTELDANPEIYILGNSIMNHIKLLFTQNQVGIRLNQKEQPQLEGKLSAPRASPMIHSKAMKALEKIGKIWQQIRGFS